MIVDVEGEVNKHKNCGDRDKLERHIQEYKNLALQHAKNFTVAGQYNMVAHRLREICDRLPAPHLKGVSGHAPSAPVKTVALTSEEGAKINAAWDQRAGNAHKGNSR